MTNKLKLYRTLSGFTQKQLAKKLGVTNDYISMIERGVRTPGFKLANKLAQLLKYSIDDLNFFKL